MLTDTQKAQVRLYTGYPDHFRYKHTRLESVLDNLSPEAETQVISALASIAIIEAAILDSIDLSGLKRVDEIWFENGWIRGSQIRKHGRMYVSRLSIITGVPIYSDVFGTRGYLGDSFSGSGGGAPSGGGNFFGLG